MQRREFLEQASKGILASVLTPAHAWRRDQNSGQGAADSKIGSLARLTAGLDADVPKWMREANVPGLSIVVIQNARIAWRHGFGVRDAASNSPVMDDVMFEAASMSKPVFAYVVMKLCEEGVIDLDVPLTKYTSERFLSGDSRLDAVTARHVLSHTSGFQNWRSDKTPLAIHFTPGTQYLYSGEGYNYLQTVVTRLMGQTFDSYMRRRLFAPLGLQSMRYVWDDVAERRMARPHDPTGKPFDNNKSSPEGVARYGSAGALLTSPSDFATFLINVVNPPPADAFRLSSKSLSDMLRPHVKLPSKDYASSWALGWQLFHNTTGDFIFHGGDNSGFHCSAIASQRAKHGYVAMTNGERGATVLRNVLTMEPMQQYLTS